MWDYFGKFKERPIIIMISKEYIFNEPLFLYFIPKRILTKPNQSAEDLTSNIFIFCERDYPFLR